MTGFSFSSLRVRLLLHVLLAVIPAFGLILYTAWEQKLIAAADAKEKALNLARNAVQEQEQLFTEARRFLSELAQQPEVESAELSTCSAFLADQLEQHPKYANIGIVNMDGNIVCSAIPMKSPLNLADRIYFRMSVETGDFSVGEYQIGRVTGKATINFGYPILDNRGKFRGVVFSALDLTWLNELLAQSHLSLGWVLTLTDQNGTILARSSEPEKWVGKTMPQSAIFKAILSRQPEGTSEAIGADGIRRLYAFAPLRVLGQTALYIMIGTPLGVAYADAHRILFRNLLLLGLVAILVLMSAWFTGNLFILQQVNALVGATRRLAHGDLSARTGSLYRKGELGQLAQSFDAMGEALQTREAELRRSKEEVERNMKRVQALREIDVAITSTLDLHFVLKVLMEKIDLLLPYTAVLVELWNKRTGLMERTACWNIDEREWKGRKLRRTPALVQQAIDTKKPAVARDMRTDPRTLDPEFYRKQGLVSYLGVPLIVKDEVLGVLVFLTREEHEFSEEEIEFLSTVAGQAAIAIHNAQLHDQTKKQSLELERSNMAMTQKAAELERSNAELQQFAYVASHDLQEPLRMVASYTQLLAKRYRGKLDSDADEFIGFAVDGVNRMQGLIKDLLAYSRVGTRGKEFEPTDCTVTLSEALTNLKVAIEESGAVVTHDPLPTVVADGTQLGQLFQNLVGNAIKFRSERPPVVHVSAKRNGKEWLFSVKDNGIGIDPQYAERIFVIFQRLHGKGEYPGTGIGLAVCKKIVERHRGRIWVESEPRKGATFYFTMPA